eukprot:TRINITY_DN1230_c0_g2_i5.p1 TRINITY_DN1230_c0_g2~~TRINITY_DN1230_c0_g2_i5.p1  ORF type:complete len:611 (-),score=182.58 TRINITY_DN1230_c0_g2_i5:59-1759(-)
MLEKFNRSYIMLDKQTYKPGHTVRARVVVLNAHSFDMAELSNNVEAKIIAPDDSEVTDLHFNKEGSIYFADWEIPEDQKGGTYKIKARSRHGDISSSEMEFSINEFSNPKMASQIKFEEDAYAPGQTVTAVLKAKRLGNNAGPAKNIDVNATAIVDGTNCFEGVAKEIEGDDEWGKYEVSFELPIEIEKGIGSLVFKMRDGEVLETRSKTIPIVMCSLDIRAFPEGGDLVQGLPTRLYIEAYNPHGEPADVSGEIIDTNGNVIGVIKTEHEGRGRSNVFTPLSGCKSLKLKITEPIEQFMDLDVKSKGAVIGLCEDMCVGDVLNVNVASSQSGDFVVKVFRLNAEVATSNVTLKSGKFAKVGINLTQKANDEGVLRVCLYSKNIPIAERLCYRVPRNKLDLSVESEGSWAPGSTVSLKIKSELVDEEGTRKPTPATLCINVTDEAVRQIAEHRELSPSLPALVMLNPEVDHLEDSEAYLNTDDEEAPLKLDLLLGTQGWRRFVYKIVDDTSVSSILENVGTGLLKKNTETDEWNSKIQRLLAINNDKEPVSIEVSSLYLNLLSQPL